MNNDEPCEVIVPLQLRSFAPSQPAMPVMVRASNASRSALATRSGSKVQPASLALGAKGENKADRFKSSAAYTPEQLQCIHKVQRAYRGHMIRLAMPVQLGEKLHLGYEMAVMQ